MLDIEEAVALHQSGRLQEAAEKYQALLSENPEDPGIWNLFGVLSGQAGYLDDSVKQISQAIYLNRNIPEYYRNLAVTLHRMGDLRREAEVQNELGNVLLRQRDKQEALNAYEQAIKLNADFGTALNNRGAALTHLGRYEDAIECLNQGLSLLEGKAEFPGAHMNLGIAYLGLNDLDRALAEFELSIELQPDFPQAHWNRALVLLLQGRLQEGWEEYEWRWKCEGFHGVPRDVPPPVWRGEKPGELAGPLLITTEQGFGDVIQFSRYLPLLVERGYDVIFETPPELYTLFAGSFAELRIKVMSTENGRVPAQDYAAFISSMSLPLRLGTTPDTIPAHTPYLKIDREKADLWRDRLKSDQRRLKVGLVWAGSPTNDRDFLRSIPAEKFEELVRHPEISFYSLQKGPEANQEFPSGTVTNLSRQLNDFTDTGAVIENLDLVITVDTSVAHLAGALNCPAWVMVTKIPDWRWAAAGNASPWYPSVRIFRQPERNDWDSVVDAVNVELQALLGSMPIATE